MTLLTTEQLLIQCQHYADEHALAPAPAEVRATWTDMLSILRAEDLLILGAPADPSELRQADFGPRGWAFATRRLHLWWHSALASGSTPSMQRLRTWIDEHAEYDTLTRLPLALLGILDVRLRKPNGRVWFQHITAAGILSIDDLVVRRTTGVDIITTPVGLMSFRDDVAQVVDGSLGRIPHIRYEAPLMNEPGRCVIHHVTNTHAPVRSSTLPFAFNTEGIHTDVRVSDELVGVIVSSCDRVNVVPIEHELLIG